MKKLFLSLIPRVLLNAIKISLDETELLALGKLLSNQQYLLKNRSLNDYEFKIFSQNGDDGIIQYLIKNISIQNKTFIEFGVENYIESNTRFLMMNNYWSGFVMDGSAKSLKQLQAQRFFWKHDLRYKAVFIDRENINNLMQEIGLEDIGLLHIDIDGNDLHILEALDLSRLNPSIISIEYNALFGKNRAITTPYDPRFDRTNAHYSNLYFGASLKALDLIANRKGYALVGCTSCGNDAYFVRRDLLNSNIVETSINEAFHTSKCRQGRDKKGRLTFISGQQQVDIIKGLPVFNIEKNDIEPF